GTLRLLHLLTELKHLSFGEAKPEPRPASAAPPPPPPPQPPAAAPEPQAAPPPPAVKPSPAPPPRPAAAARPTPARGSPPVVRLAQPPPRPAAPTRTYATAPPDETPQAQLARLRAIVARLEQGTHFEALGVDKRATPIEV